MIRFLIAALAAFLLVACGGGEFVSGRGGLGGTSSSDGGRVDVGGTSSSDGGRVDVGGTSSEGGASGAVDAGSTGGGLGGTSGGGGLGGGGASSSAGAACTSFDASKPSLPARCQKIQNNPSGPCNAGDTCITLEQAVTSSGPTEDLCQPTAIKTTCAACRETMTCACLAADFTFDKTGLEKWRCCDTAAGPLFVSGYTCPK